MEKHIRRNLPCFFFELADNPSYNELWEATQRIKTEPITLTHKDFDADYTNLINTINNELIKNNLFIKQQVVYDLDHYALSFILHHDISGQYYEKRYPIQVNNDHPEFELSIKFLKIRSYIDVLGLTVTDVVDSLPLNRSITESITISHNDIKSYFDCKRCFYLVKKCQIKRDYDNDKFTLSNANDNLLKDEFHQCRQVEKAHPILMSERISAIPFNHKDIPIWQNSHYGQGGIRFHDKSRNFILTGIIDEVLQNQSGQLIVVDFKTTSKDMISIDDALGASYRRQISFYSYLLNKNNFHTSDIGYLILDKPVISTYDYTDVILGKTTSSNEYVFNPFSTIDTYQRKLKFQTTVIKVSIDYSWIEETLDEILQCITSPELPNIKPGKQCFNCSAYQHRKKIETWFEQKKAT